MVRSLAAFGHEVDLLTFAQGDDIDIPGVRHRRSLRLPVGRIKPGASLAKMILDVPFMAQAGWRLLAGGYDVVHAVEEAAHLMAPLARILRVPLVADVDSSIPQQLRYSGFARRGPLVWIAKGLERFALRGAVAAITVCRSLTDAVGAQAPATAVFQIEDPPLVGGTTPERDALTRLRNRLGLGPQPIVLYTGNFEPYQGVELLLAAVRLVENVSLLIVGGKPEEVAALRQKVAAAGCAARVVFAGAQPPVDLPLYLGLADVVVSPRLEGTNTPFKLYTYMASGKPIVATRIESHTQVLDDDIAFLCEPTAPSLAAAIGEVVSDLGGAARRAAGARALLDREYSEARYLEKVRFAYREIARRIGVS